MQYANDRLVLEFGDGKSLLVLDGDIVGRGALGKRMLKPHPEVSRRHAAFQCVEGEWYVQDLGSKNGTFLEGKRIAPKKLVRLRSGQRLGLSPALSAQLKAVSSLADRTAEAAAVAPGAAGKDRVTIVILFADLQGSTDYFQEQGTIVASNWIMNFYNLLIRIVTDSQGTHIKNIGDAIMAVFEDPEAAARAAVKMQTSIAEHNSHAKPTERYFIRIGINMGKVIYENRDVFGNAVNIASRVQSITPPGLVYITDRMYARIRGMKGLSIDFVSYERLKGVRDSVGIYELLPRKTRAQSKTKPA